MPDIASIVGTDGWPPVLADSKFHIFSLYEIFRGQEGLNKIVPRVNDLVIDNLANPIVIYRVTDINNVTLIPELTVVSVNCQPRTDPNNPSSPSPSSPTLDNYISSSTLDNYRLYYDKSVYPYTLQPDGFLRVYGSAANYYVIYKGAFIDNTKIISRMYDNSGNLLGTEIPLELVQFNSHDNYGVKALPACKTISELQNGDICTIVVYTSNNKVITKTTCIVDETTYVAPAFAEQKYITQIELISPFMSSTNDGEILYPVNMQLNSYNLKGKVHYNDGSSVEYPIDNSKFRLYGLNGAIINIVGYRIPLVLAYKLSSNESALASTSVDDGYITRPYSLVVTNPNTSYSVRLFIYPVWVTSTNEYSYKAFLLNLDRNIIFDVTNKITLDPNSPSFTPLAYGVTQRLTFNVNLQNVSGVYNYFIYSQTTEIILRGPPTDNSLTNIWEVTTQIPTTRPRYGTNLKASRSTSDTHKVTIHNNIATVNEFIEKLYLNTMPLYNPSTETGPLEPTHIAVKFGNESITVPISQYNQEFTFSSSVSFYSSIEVIFYRETATGMLTLGISLLTVR